jgi:hypothetical protein
MNLAVGLTVRLKNKITSNEVNVVIESIEGQNITFKSVSGDVFSIDSRTLVRTYDITITSIQEEEEEGPARISGNIEEYKSRRLIEILNNINPNETREENQARIKNELRQLAEELRANSYPEDQAMIVENQQFTIPLEPPSITLSKLFQNNFSISGDMNGSKYMHSFLTKDYLLTEFRNVEEVKNFISVINMNKSGVLLKEFKDNKIALTNIILGLIRISYSIDILNIKYEYAYDIIYKDQVLDNVVFDFDQWKLNRILAVIKTHGEEEVLIQIKDEELKRLNIIQKEVVRNTDDLGIDEIPEPIRVEFGAGINYLKEGLKFGKDYLKVIVSNEELADKIIKFINGALLLYPEIMVEIPENIKLVEEDFSVFEYQKMIAAARQEEQTAS